MQIKKAKIVRNKNTTSEGYTLVEVIVATTIFIIGIGLVVGVFIQSLRSERMINSIMESNGNASIALEQMMREIRTGYNFATSTQGSGLCFARGLSDKLTFTRYIGNASTTVSFAWDTSIMSIERDQTDPTTGVISTSTENASTVFINPICFRLTQQNSTSSPWRIGIFATISPSDPRLQNKAVNVETTVSARALPEEVQ